MATTYRAKEHIRCWKQHRCVSCGAVYRYIFDRQIVASASTPRGAAQAAQKQAQEALADEVDPQPCPQCGLYQPDMLSQNKADWHKLLTILTFLVLVVVVLLIALSNLSSHRFPLIVVGIAAVIVAGHFWAALRDLNRNPVANRKRAEQAIARGEMILDTPGGEARPSQGSESKRLPVVALAALALGVLSAPLSEVARVAGGWPLNQPASPQIAGPGDTVRLELPHTVTSAGGYWSADAHASVVGAGDRSFPVSSRQDTWGDKIITSSKQRSSTSSLWADVTVPDEPGLARQTLQLQLNLDITYPQLFLFSKFTNERESYSHTLELKLASPGAGRVYYRLWWGGMAACAILLLAAGAALALRERAGVSNTQVQLIPIQA